MPDVLGTQKNFSSLSVRDLLFARDLYHYHLLNKENVVGTAVGLYLIRKEDPYPEQIRKSRTEARNDRGERSSNRSARTFANSEVRDYSWPCVLALVRDWVKESDFGGRGLHPEQMVPKTLYLPDGRMVPVCVVEVQQGEPSELVLPNWQWPSGLFGGGMPIVAENQGVSRRATTGCLVTDGRTTYALTSRHACGEPGQPVYTIARGERRQIGRSSDKQLSRLEFVELYPEFAGQRTYVNLDVGLVELDDLNDWTSQVYGLGQVGALADLSEVNITTRLIDQPVVALGATSGRLEGRIKALFYRYKSVGGYDYVADFLIAPRALGASTSREQRHTQTEPGDSGAVWHLVTNQKLTGADPGWTEDDEFEGELRPLATQWGGQVFVESAAEQRFSFALATSLTIVSRTLDVELVQEHNTGVRPYWGQMGHYSIATFATRALASGKLKTLVSNNVDRISFAPGELTPSEIAARLKEARDTGGFVPLADVPDIIWKKHKSQVKGGRDDQFVGGRPTGPEHPTHYADIDEPRQTDQKTLRQLCLENAANLSVSFWQQFYDAAGHHASRDRGLLPFRVWQFFDEMKKSAAEKDVDRFLCAAGIVSHYVGDACQTLHGSIYADGYPDGGGKGIHSAYETRMIDRYASDLRKGISQAVQDPGAPLPTIQTGKQAALAVIELMDRSAQRIPPTELVDKYIDAGGGASAKVLKALWDAFGDATIQAMADGARVLAQIWAGAWNAGQGDKITTGQLVGRDWGKLQTLYEDPDFVPSLDLDHIGTVLQP
ncbi:MAG: S1/P1 Nuclease [Armatimonadota bacterium]